MKIKKGCQASSSEFWYDLSFGGYLDPYDILEHEEDAAKVVEAVRVLKEFEQSCDEQIEGCVQ